MPKGSVDPDQSAPWERLCQPKGRKFVAVTSRPSFQKVGETILTRFSPVKIYAFHIRGYIVQRVYPNNLG